MEFKIDPCVLENNSEIIIPDNASMTSQEMLAQDDDIEYEVKGDDGVVAYRVVQIPENKLPLLAPAPAPSAAVPQSTTTAHATIPQQCQFYLISNDLVTQTATVVPPKLQRQIGPVVRKRNDQRRATHNEVERRRRDKINHWIKKLGSIMPENTTATGLDDLTGATGCSKKETMECNLKSSSDNNSKSNILAKACEYIPMLQDHIGSLKECLKESENTTAENQKLRECNSRLRVENERLKLVLKKVGVKIELPRTTKDGPDSS